MALWMGRAHAYGLNSMKIGNSVPSPRVRGARSTASLYARHTPRSPSKIVAAPVNPSSAMMAAVTPLRAEGPGLKRFHRRA